MTDDLVKRLRGGLPCGDVKCVERSAAGGCTCGEAADRIEKLEAALHNVTTSWDLWQKANDSKSFTELFACICEAKALEGKDV